MHKPIQPPYMKKAAGFLLLLLLTLTGPFYTFANDDGGKKKKERKEAFKGYENFNEQYYRSQNRWDDPTLSAMRARAASSVNEVEAQQRYVDFLAPSDLNRLPLGMKKKIGNTTVKIAVSNAVFTNRYAELTVYAKIEIPQHNSGNVGSSTTTANDKKTIFFGVKGLKLSKDGGIIGDAKLVLLGDYTIPLSGDKSSLVLKGGFDMNTGQAADKTYITIDCNGFKELGLAADVAFPRSMLIPTDAQGNQIAGNVKASFSTVVSNWNDILASVSLPSFEIKGLDGIGFKIDQAVVDLSDHRNSPDIIYPVGYQQKYIGNDETSTRLWRGVYAKELQISLPASFQARQSSNRVAFGTQNLLIDNNGITGLFYAQNILPLHKGSAGGWQFSVDSFRIALEANRLLRAGFGGRVGLPVNKEATAQTEADTIQRRKYMAYSAMITSTGDYLCRVVTKDSLSFDVWKASVMLKPNSYIELAGNKERFRPSAMLHGSMNISSKTSTAGNERANKILDFKGVEFQGLHLKTEAPYITAQYFGYNGAIKLGIIPVSIDSIALKSFSASELGIGFNLKVNLQDSSFGGRTRLYVIGKYNGDQGIGKWQYDRLKVEDISINAKIGTLKLNGTVAFLDDDPKYGDGFRGQIGMTLEKPSLTVTVTALFGNKGFRYWFVDGLAELPVSAGTGVFNIHGFGGGAYYRMRKEGFSPTLAPSGLEYVPDSTAGLGIRASVLFDVGSKKLDHGQATLEVAFNRHSGMRYIGFYGFAKILSPLEAGSLPGGGISSFVKEQFGAIENTMKDWSPTKIEGNIQKKLFQPSAAAAEMWTNVPTSFDTDLRAVLGISYDFNNDVFHANFDLYVSADNFLNGVGPGGRAGWAVMHIQPGKWYMHMGTPADPIGVKIGLGPVSVQTSAYFMLGHDLPAFPPLPAPLQAVMAQNNIQYQSNINIEAKEDIKAAKGVAFGAGVHLATGDIKFLILYSNFQAGMGFDVMVKDYSNYVCQETNQKPGFNGWYAQGRVYAYLQGECGVRVKLGFINKKIPIIKGAAVALLEARLPKPSWFGGLFHINVRLLGGLVKVNVNLKFAFGENCTLVANQNGGGEIDFDEFRVVTATNPAPNAQQVSLFTKPLVSCLTTPEAPFKLPPDEGQGGGDETYRPHIASINFTAGGKTFGSTYKLSSDSTKFTIYPDSNLIAQTDYTLAIKIIYQKLVSGNTWVDVTDENGNPHIENNVIPFRTGDNPPFIAEENIGFMYPYINQKFFYKQEVSVGRILLKSTQNELFASFSRWKARFKNSSNQVIGVTDVTYDPGLKTVSYGLPQLELNKPYKLEIYGEGYNIGSLVTDTSRPILQFAFSTSKYGTLQEKFAALQAAQPTPVVGRVESDVIDLQAKISDYEGFDIAEMLPMPLTGNMPLINAEALLDDNYYYNTKIQPLIRYPYFFPSASISISRDAAEFGLVPTKAIALSQYYVTAAQSPNYNTILYDRLPFIYDLNRVFNSDFIELRNRIVNKFMANMAGAPTHVPMYEWYRPCWLCSRRQRMRQEWVNYFNSPAYRQAASAGDINNIPVEMRDIVTKPFPFMTKGDYKVRFQLKRATTWSGPDNFNTELSTPVVFNYQNPIESLFFNEWQALSFTKNDCSSGETGGSVTYSINPGIYSSTVSQADANQKAINAINGYGQTYANQNGTCCVNGNCYVPGTVLINLTGYLGCSGMVSISFEGTGGSYTYYFPSDWQGASTEIQIPAGTYQVHFNSDNYSGYNSYQIDNPYQSLSGTSASTGQISFSAGTFYYISATTNCGGGYGYIE